VDIAEVCAYPVREVRGRHHFSLQERQGGAGTLGCDWLMSQGYGLDKIAPAMVALGDSGTLAQLYANLTQVHVFDEIDPSQNRVFRP
jgi:hypothetical protein